MPHPTSDDQQKALYDEACKTVLSEKGIAAHILKECVEEYKDISVEDIVHKYIQGKPEISKVMIQDETVLTKIRTEQTEDSSEKEGIILKYTELTGLLRLLNMALLDKLNGSEKRRIMATEFNIEITPELEKGVDDMCNLSAGIEKKGIAEGENRLSKLIAHLLKIGRNDEIKAATESEKLRKELYKKYGIA